MRAPKTTVHPIVFLAMLGAIFACGSDATCPSGFVLEDGNCVASRGDSGSEDGSADGAADASTDGGADGAADASCQSPCQDAGACLGNDGGAEGACCSSADCGSTSASRCDQGVCAQCLSHDDCAHLEGTPACQDGTCVVCADDHLAACPSEAPACQDNTCVTCTDADPGACEGTDTPACQDNTCVTCTDADPGACEGTDTPACQDNACVLCTEANPVACEGNTCSAIDGTCREDVTANSVPACGDCASDTECESGHACVITPAAPGFALGHCLPIKDGVDVTFCSGIRRFRAEEVTQSVSGASVTVCRPAVTTCEVFTDPINQCGVTSSSQTCTTPRTLSGKPDRACTNECTIRPSGALICATRCYAACTTNTDCPVGGTCITPNADNYVTSPLPAKVCTQ